MKKFILPILMVGFFILMVAVGAAIDPWRNDLEERKATPEQHRHSKIEHCYKTMWNKVVFDPSEATLETIRNTQKNITLYCEKEVDK